MPALIPLTTPAAPAATAPPVAPSTTPPVVDLPTLPLGFVPPNLLEFRGLHPKAAQLAALPDVILELQTSTAYEATFGPAAPPAAALATTLSNASGWTSTRMALENYLVFVKTQEGGAWKAAKPQIDQVKAVYTVTAERNADVPGLFPALTRFVDADSVIAKKAAATRKRAKAASVATPATTATSPVTPPANASPAPATSATTATIAGGTGGAAH